MSDDTEGDPVRIGGPGGLPGDPDGPLPQPVVGRRRNVPQFVIVPGNGAERRHQRVLGREDVEKFVGQLRRCGLIAHDR